MDRRTFLATGASIVAGAAFAREPKKRDWKKAVNLGMAKGGSIEERFRRIREAGFDGVEVNRPDADPLEDLLRARDATGLPISNVICSTHWAKPLTHPDPATREQGRRGLELALQEAGELHAPTVLLVPGVVNKEVTYAEAYERAFAAIRQALPVAEKARVQIAIENVWNHFLLSPLEAARFVDELGSPWAGWHFDIGNVVASGWPEQWVRILGRRILALHFKDFSRKKRDEEGMGKGFGVELGEGDVDWKAVMAALDETRFAGWSVLEVAGGDAARLRFLAERIDQLLAS